MCPVLLENTTLLEDTTLSDDMLLYQHGVLQLHTTGMATAPTQDSLGEMAEVTAKRGSEKMYCFICYETRVL